MNKLVDVERRQSDQQQSITDHEKRISSIERTIPGLKETRTWIVSGVLAVVSAVIWAALTGHIT